MSRSGHGYVRVLCVALCAGMQSTCDGPICSSRIPTSGLSSKIQKQKANDSRGHCFGGEIGTEVEKSY